MDSGAFLTLSDYFWVQSLQIIHDFYHYLSANDVYSVDNFMDPCCWALGRNHLRSPSAICLIFLPTSRSSPSLRSSLSTCEPSSSFPIPPTPSFPQSLMSGGGGGVVIPHQGQGGEACGYQGRGYLGECEAFFSYF